MQRTWRTIVVLAAFTCLLGSCRESGRDSLAKEDRNAVTTRPPITDVLARHSPELMAIAGVTGTAEGASKSGEPLFVILVEKRTRELTNRLPKEIEGYAVEIRETGVIRPMGR